MEEQEILDIQLTDKISRGLARQKYYARYLERGESFASKVTEPRAGKVPTNVTRPAVSGGDKITEIHTEETMEDQIVATKRNRNESETELNSN